MNKRVTSGFDLNLDFQVQKHTPSKGRFHPVLKVTAIKFQYFRNLTVGLAAYTLNEPQSKLLAAPLIIPKVVP